MTITATLGPTNTGKTHRAVEQMLSHRSGMIGLPLRLLAREVYDRITVRIGEREVALITGEEKRVPPKPRYWVCTVESMPTDLDVDFVCVDEIQLAADRQRGHTFTERLLHARGTIETWFLGSDQMRPIVQELPADCRGCDGIHGSRGCRISARWGWAPCRRAPRWWRSRWPTCTSSRSGCGSGTAARR